MLSFTSSFPEYKYACKGCSVQWKATSKQLNCPNCYDENISEITNLRPQTYACNPCGSVFTPKFNNKINACPNCHSSNVREFDLNPPRANCTVNDTPTLKDVSLLCPEQDGQELEMRQSKPLVCTKCLTPCPYAQSGSPSTFKCWSCNSRFR